jgi:hypothetical protein
MNSRKSHLKDVHCIYPGDLYGFLRKPFFLIVDSSNSFAFQNFPNLFGQPFLSMLSPVKLPNIFQEMQNHQGCIFTLFLTNPLFAFCYICKINHLTTDTFNKSQMHMKIIFIEIAKAIYKSKQLNNIFLQFCNDDFLRVFILRFVFCYISLKLHRGFKDGGDYYPLSQPLVSNDILENVDLYKLVINLSVILSTEMLFKTDIND